LGEKESMPKIYDNIENQFSVGLAEHLANASRVDYCVGYFNLRGWNMVCDAVNKLPGAMIKEKDSSFYRHCRLLIGMTKTPREELLDEFSDPDELLMDNEKANRYRKKLAAEFAEQLTYGLPTQADELTLQVLLEQLNTGKVTVKLFLRHQLHAKLYLAHGGGNITPVVGLVGSSNFTLAGLSQQGELNVDVIEQDAAQKLDKWFTARWLDRWCIDITKDLITIVENCWARPDLIPPYLIYLKIAYHLSKEARAGLAEYSLSREFAGELLDFQQAAVKIAAHHLHNRRGVMIGDVVGLGKTITATAVAKILEDDLYYNTLITCPKNLVPMWEKYREKYGLHARVVPHSMLRQTLPDLRRYKLVIVDESHNFRNNLGDTYRALKSYIEENESHVILLSATPYNKSYVDLSNQLKLFLPDDCDLGITPENYIKSLGGIVQFTAKHTDTNVRTINAFEKSFFADDWREVMKLYLVRRTRSFIKTNYAKTDSETGRKYLEFSTGEKSFFPDRIPKKVEFSLNGNDPADQYAALYETTVVDAINALNLPRYGLQRYYDDKACVQPTKEESIILNNLSRAGKSVIGFCRTNLYKRLESCGYSFLLSLSRHVLRNHIFLYAIKHGFDLPVSGQSVAVDFYSDEDEEMTELNMNFSWTNAEYEVKSGEFYRLFQKEYRTRFQWIRSTIFKADELLADLEADTENILNVLAKVGMWKAPNDRKMDALQKLLTQTHFGEKVLVFTQFADTAKYILHELDARKVGNTAVAIGGSNDIVDLVSRFSPRSNDCPAMPEEMQIRILVSTDVLSEGQNLQDAHIIVNFDLPWAIVRLIQRAGRVDRLGQKASEIVCYSFLPEDGIEHIIGLRQKLTTRISQNAEVVGSDEVFFEGDPINILDLYSEKSGIFDDDEDTEVDLASYAYQIWKNAIDAHPDLMRKIENMPSVVFGAKANETSHSGDGVIVYARTRENNDALAWLDGYGQVVTQSQYAILKAAECGYATPAFPKLAGHHQLVAKGVVEIHKETTAISGTLGRKNSVKYRTYMRLQRFFEEKTGTLFALDGLKYALDAIYQYPLRENAIDALSRQMRSGITDEGLAGLVMSLYDSGRLCIVPTDSSTEQSMTQIICSMSLIGEAQ
jgi:superfamily II DNA or RNA helicase